MTTEEMVEFARRYNSALENIDRREHRVSEGGRKGTCGKDDPDKS